MKRGRSRRARPLPDPDQSTGREASHDRIHANPDLWFLVGDGLLPGRHVVEEEPSEIRLIDKWPTAYIQFDSGMSQEDALRFLELAREMVLAGPEKVTAENALKDDEESLDAFWAQSLKTGLASFESRSKSSHSPRDPQ